MYATFLQYPRHVRLFHEAVVHNHRMKITPKMYDFNPPFRGNAGNILGDNVQQDNPYMKHFVMLKVVQQRYRNDVDPACQVDGCARHAVLVADLGDEIRQGQCVSLEFTQQRSAETKATGVECSRKRQRLIVAMINVRIGV